MKINKSYEKEGMGLIPEEKALKENGSAFDSLISEQRRKSSGEGRRRSKESDMLGVGSTTFADSQNRSRRGSSVAASTARTSVPDGREYKYWMMVNWTPHVSSCKMEKL